MSESGCLPGSAPAVLETGGSLLHIFSVLLGQQPASLVRALCASQAPETGLTTARSSHYSASICKERARCNAECILQSFIEYVSTGSPFPPGTVYMYVSRCNCAQHQKTERSDDHTNTAGIAH